MLSNLPEPNIENSGASLGGADWGALAGGLSPSQQAPDDSEGPASAERPDSPMPKPQSLG